jgi:glucose-1-phosphate adenylyltransferase
MSYFTRTNAQQLSKDTLVILLAGGQGSRLHELTESRAKPVLEFGGGYRIIDFPLSNCMNSGLTQIGVATQYKAQCLIRHLVTTWTKFNAHCGEFLELLPASQQHAKQWYTGTADSLFQNITFIQSVKAKYVLVLSGDHVYKMDYRDMLEAHIRNDVPMTVSCIETPLRQAAGQFGVVSVDNKDKVMSFDEKPKAPKGLIDKPDHVLASMGNYVFDTDFLIEQLKQDAIDQNSSHDFGKDIIPKVVSKYNIHAFRFRTAKERKPAYWRDVGTLDAYWEANMALLKGKPAIDFCDTNWPIWSTRSCLPPARFTGEDAANLRQISNSLVSGGCVVKPSILSNTLVFEQCVIGENTQITDTVLLPNVKIGNNVVIKKAIIDRDCNIPNGMQIGLKSKLDLQRGFRISENGVVLVTQSMLNKLSAKANKTPNNHCFNERDLCKRQDTLLGL